MNRPILQMKKLRFKELKYETYSDSQESSPSIVHYIAFLADIIAFIYIWVFVALKIFFLEQVLRKFSCCIIFIVSYFFNLKTTLQPNFATLLDILICSSQMFYINDCNYIISKLNLCKFKVSDFYFAVSKEFLRWTKILWGGCIHYTSDIYYFYTYISACRISLPDMYKLCVQHDQIDQSNQGLAFFMYMIILNSRLRRCTQLKFLPIKVLRAELVISECILAGLHCC